MDDAIIARMNGSSLDPERSMRGALSSADYVEEKTKLVATQREAAELKLQQARGDLIALAEVQAVFEAIMTVLAGRLEMIPRQLRAKFPHAPPELFAYVDRLIREAREEAAAGAAGAGIDATVD